jgi:hydrogenase-4 component F
VETFAWLVAAFPLLAAFSMTMPRSERIAPQVTIAAAAGSLVSAAIVLSHVQAVGTLVVIAHFVEVDAFSGLILVLVALVSTTAAVFSWGYIATGNPMPRRTRLYYANFNLFVLSMLTIPLTVELGVVWICVELTTLLSVLLVSFANTHQALEAAWKYMVLTLIGATVAVLGILILFWSLHATGSSDFTWSGLRAAAHAMPPALVKAAFVLILIGYGAKVGLVPLHTWLPDAHSQAPSPVCALLSGIETTTVLYVLIRLRPIFDQSAAVDVEAWFAVFGLISVGAAVLLILQTHDYKRLFAFSTVEHMGIIMVAASFATPLGDAAVAWQMIAHAVTKSFCFYAAGATLIATGSRDIADIQGLLGRSKTAAWSLIIGALAISGAPPFAVFLSELAVFRAGILAHEYLVTGVLAAFIVLGFFGVLWHVTNMAFGTPRAALADGVRLPYQCGAALALAAIPVLVLGVWVPLGNILRLSAAALGS